MNQKLITLFSFCLLSLTLLQGMFAPIPKRPSLSRRSSFVFDKRQGVYDASVAIKQMVEQSEVESSVHVKLQAEQEKSNSPENVSLLDADDFWINKILLIDMYAQANGILPYQVMDRIKTEEKKIVRLKSNYPGDKKAWVAAVDSKSQSMQKKGQCIERCAWLKELHTEQDFNSSWNSKITGVQPGMVFVASKGPCLSGQWE